MKSLNILSSVWANKEAKDNFGTTPLIIASQKGHLEVVNYPFSVGANKEARDNNGFSPLSSATSNEVVNYLISV